MVILICLPYVALHKSFQKHSYLILSLFHVICCSLGTVKFESARNLLKQKQLIHGIESKICKPIKHSTQCSLCGITQICAAKVKNTFISLAMNDVNLLQNPMTGAVEETFKTPYTNPQHKIGGRGTVCLYVIGRYNECWNIAVDYAVGLLQGPMPPFMF